MHRIRRNQRERQYDDAGVSYRFTWEVPAEVDPVVRPMIDEIVRRGRRNEHLGDNDERNRLRWSKLNLLLGTPAAILAGISGAVILGSPSSNVLAGVIALVAAAIGALVGFLNPSERARQAEIAANRYWLISAWVRFVVTAEAPTADRGAARALLLELQRREETVMTTAISGAPPESALLPPETTSPRESQARGSSPAATTVPLQEDGAGAA